VYGTFIVFEMPPRVSAAAPVGGGVTPKIPPDRLGRPLGLLEAPHPIGVRHQLLWAILRGSAMKSRPGRWTARSD